MSPAAYQQAREQEPPSDDPTAASSVVIIHGRPYLPHAVVDVTCHDSVRSVAYQVLFHPLKLPDRLWQSYLTVQPVSGGITNTLFLVEGWHELLVAASSSRDDGEGEKDEDESLSSMLSLLPKAVLLRVFGAVGMIDRDLENTTYAALASKGIAPPYWGRFANGRIEGWMHGYHHLSVRQMAQPAVAHDIAAALAVMHGSFLIQQLPQEFSGLQDYYHLDQPSMWTQLQEWLDQAVSTTFFQTEHDTQRAARLDLPNTMPRELEWLKTQIPADAPVVFCHNDLLAANVLYKTDDDDTTTAAASNRNKEPTATTGNRIQLIDFEYGGVNYRSFDIANHFAEYAGGPPVDASPKYEWLPDQEAQRAFIRSYLITAAALDLPDETAAAVVVDDAAIDNMLHEVQTFTMASHLYWGLWAVNQAAAEGCQTYDYMLFGMNRFQQYWVTKQEYCAARGVV